MPGESAGWPIKLLGEVVEVLDRLRVPVNSDERAMRPGTVPYFGANGQQGWIDRALFNEDLILLAEDGGNFDEFSTSPIAYRIDGPSWVNNHAHVLRAGEQMSQSFLFWSLVHRDIRRYISGGTRTKLTQGELRSVELSLPSLPEQRRIAEILDTLDEAIRKTEQVIAKLQQMKQGLLHDLLTRGIDENGQLRDPQRHPEQFKDSPLGRIPKDWEVGSVESACGAYADCPHSTPDYLEHGIPCIRTADIVPGELLLDQARRVDEKTHRERTKRLDVRPGDVMFSREGERLGMAASVGQEPVCMAQRVMQLRPGAKTDPRYLVWVLNSAPFYRSIKNLIGATTSPHVNVAEVLELPIPIARSEEQRRIGDVITAHFGRIDAERTKLKKLRTLKQGLMDDLLTGRVRVNVEDASA